MLNQSNESTSSKSIEKNVHSEIQNSRENNCEHNYWFEKLNQNKLKIFFILSDSTNIQRSKLYEIT